MRRLAHRWGSRWVVTTTAVAAAAAITGCDPGPSSGAPKGEAEPSPNASIPARRLSVADAAAGDAATGPSGLLLGPDARYVLPDAAPPPPTPIDADEPIRPDELTARELVGVSLAGHWLWREVPVPPEGAAVNVEAIREARRLAGFRSRIDISGTGRMRMELLDVAMPMPRGSAILARADRYGALVLWPNGTHYRIAPAGSMRATFGDRRVDVAPLDTLPAKEAGSGSRLDQKTRIFELASPVGKARLETAKLAEAGHGGPLLCRLFADMVGVHPSTSACADSEVVLRAQLDWTEGGGLDFEVSAATKRTDLAGTDLLVPPMGAAYLSSGLPASPEGIFFTREQLQRFRKEPVKSEAPPDRGAPGEGVSANNQTDRLMYLLLDGVPIAAVPPWGERYVIGPQAGQYRLQWRTFLGDVIEPPFETTLPARVSYGAIDAGVESSDGG